MALQSATLAESESGESVESRNGLRRRLLHSPLTLTGLVITLIFVVLAIIGPWISPYDPSAVSDAALAGPSAAHWLGTTQNGQDVFSQMLYGARASMIVGLGAAVLTTVLSVLVGVTAGYLGGIGDEVLSLLANVFLVLPGLPLTIILAAYLPHTGNAGIILVITVTGWAWGARVLRAQTLSLRKRDFVEAARATGDRTSRIILRDILPNQVAVIAAAFLGTVTGAILTQASLAFLGLTDVTQWSWGTILYWAQVSSALLTGSWWWFVPAGLAIALLGTALSLVNFGIDEFINPRLRQAGIGTKKAQRAQVKRTRRSLRRRARRERAERPTRAPFTSESTDLILDVRGLKVDYLSGNTRTPAVDDVSFALRRGEVLGIAGESGSGKSTLAYAIARMHKPPAQISDGRIIYTNPDGSTVDVLGMSDAELREFRWEELSIVLQSAMHALNPILRIGVQIEDVIIAHRPRMSSQERAARILELLAIVGIPADRANSYPHELSGGMRQRAMIAVGLALDPEIIVMDEPTTALDVVIQRQIIEKIVELKDKLGFSVIFITHDLSLLIELSDTIAVMYGGKIVEKAAADEFYRNAQHPYSRGLLNSFPTLGGPKRELTGIPGSPPDLRRLPDGCAFQPRCPVAVDECRSTMPPLYRITSSTGESSEAACLLYAAAQSTREMSEDGARAS
ncbi:dipeptide/oligopeptide/nickel ABC transporter permease/ATP-binding protein [Actinospica sp.]|jgi:oligopeptide/dipeptide ABC transporter ATP-binding protein|uniref:dipeptide/oligopeptide/nickel ABC transporter permease/ATP-binding protein n=1 Tax=Actinospica sp. TaxID=1872142 RepID=UPI002CBC411A|nr:dipeptide/oligopeptide/nickel ABC transporter permease/ATP-binding protein [Actinospica sp.]HWG27135.1 dipeptide/oligopeptide/nickel ABC transporter permease/ATP-binding protein [Actinospica sp.]